MAIVILFIVLFFLLPDLYISLVLMKDAAWWAHVLLWLPTIVVLGLMLTFKGGISATKIQLFSVLALCFALPKIAFAVLSLLGRLLGHVWSQAAFFGNSFGVIVASSIALLAFYGVFFGWKALTVKEVKLSFPDLPEAFDGYRIVQLSDLHVGTYGDKTAYLEKIVHRVNDEQADLVVFTGDLINLSPEEISPFEEVLSELKAKDGVLSVLGNHDYGIYGMSRRQPSDIREVATPVIEAEHRMGWELLLNEHWFIHRGADSLAVVGVENTSKPPFPNIGDLKGAMAGISEGTFTILLSHDPTHWRMEVVPETDIPLMLAGHTHAMQFKIGSWSPVKWIYPEWSGLYEKGPQQLYVSEGIGGGFPFRLGTKPEIVVIALERDATK